MRTKHLFTVLLFCVSLPKLYAQETKTTRFQPAVAKQDHYDALYFLNSSDEKKITGIVRNIKNVLNDPRLKGKLHIELLVYGDGVELFKNRIIICP